MEKWNRMLNIVMGSVVGAFVGRSLYVVWQFKTRWELYAMQSAPWYTSILVDGAFALAVVAVCIAIKAIIRNRRKPD